MWRGGLELLGQVLLGSNADLTLSSHSRERCLLLSEW